MRIEELDNLTREEFLELNWEDISNEEAISLWNSERQDFVLLSMNENVYIYGGAPMAGGTNLRSDVSRVYTIREKKILNDALWEVFEDGMGYSYAVCYLSGKNFKEIFCQRCTWSPVEFVGDFCRWCK